MPADLRELSLAGFDALDVVLRLCMYCTMLIDAHLMWCMSLPNLAELPMPCTLITAAWASSYLYFMSKRCIYTFTCIIALHSWLPGDITIEKQGISLRHSQCPLQGARLSCTSCPL